ncbi:hypothetical protein SK128_022980 [Halocaridina rubra]|uniref:CHK kinase-like domain-containing protein n=1 Tax=Halocaridina rubra TaxID=373956 RepID=A0AAN9A6S1_HALRR
MNNTVLFSQLISSLSFFTVANTNSEVAVTPQSLVNGDDVKKVLEADKRKEAQLISYEVIDFTKRGDNYACVVSSVKVKYDLHEKQDYVSYVVKLNPCRNFTGYEDLTAIMFKKEAKFYADIVPELNAVLEALNQDPLKFPKCYHYNLTMGKEQIYFEDLRSRDFRMFDRRKGMDELHTPLVLREMARLHAAAYLLQCQNPKEPLEQKFDFLKRDWLNFTDNDAISEMMRQLLHNYLTNSISMLKRVGGYESAIAWVESLIPRVEEILTQGMQSKRFGTINHGDCWNNNILFRYDDEGKPIDVILLDLQICRKASLACDLNYFLYTSLTGSVRQPNLKDFLSTYYSSYKGVLEDAGRDMFFNEDDLMKEFREKNTLGAFFGMMIVPIMLMEPEDVPDMSGKDDSDMDNLVQEFQDKAMDMLNTNPLLKPRFLAIFDDMMETGLIP